MTPLFNVGGTKQRRSDALDGISGLGQKGEKLHYEAMIDDNYKYVGSSNLYIDDVAIRTHKNRGVQFDIFAGSLSTPINH